MGDKQSWWKRFKEWLDQTFGVPEQRWIETIALPKATEFKRVSVVCKDCGQIMGVAFVVVAKDSSYAFTRLYSSCEGPCRRVPSGAMQITK